MISRRECMVRWGRLVRYSRGFASTAPPVPAASSGERRAAYLRRASDIPLLKETVGQVLQRTADKFPERTAVVSHYQNKRITFHELIKKADRLGAGLLALGLARGDRVAVWGPNSLEWVIAKLACARAGLVLVTLNPAYQAKELEHCLRKVGVKGLICNHTFKTQNYHNVMLQVAPDIASGTPGNLKCERLPDFKALVTITDELLPGSLRFSEVIAAGTDLGVREVRSMQTEVNPHDIVEIQFTSGTTGSPKAAMLSHYNIVNNAHIHNLRRFTTGAPKNHDIVCSLVPFFHVFASVIGILACVETGDTLLVAGPHYEAKTAYDAIRAEKWSDGRVWRADHVRGPAAGAREARQQGDGVGGHDVQRRGHRHQRAAQENQAEPAPRRPPTRLRHDGDEPGYLHHPVRRGRPESSAHLRRGAASPPGGQDCGRQRQHGAIWREGRALHPRLRHLQGLLGGPRED
ncbi:hypothetical protein FOCC_FOCC003079, partial [Frankliniella occidentalis]